MRTIAHSCSCAALALALVGLTGCGLARGPRPHVDAASLPQAPAVGPNVVVLKGTVGYWPECDAFVQKLNEQGASTTVIRALQANKTADTIAAARLSGSQTGPLVLIGYNRGANDAIRLTRRLQRHGVEVDSLILLEAASQATVPANVASCLNVYKSSSTSEWVPPFRGLPVTVESAHTDLVNYNLRFHDEAAGAGDFLQITVCQNPVVQAMVVERVAQSVRPPEAPKTEEETQLATRQ